MRKTVIVNWLKNAELYDDNTCGQMLVTTLLCLIGYFVLGFSLGDNKLEIFSNAFLMLCCLASLLLLTLIFYRSIFAFLDNSSRANNKAQTTLDNFENKEKRRIIDEYLKNNRLPVRQAPLIAIVFLGCFALVEFFIVNSWVSNSILVWQPDWLTSTIDIVRGSEPPAWFIDSSFLDANYIGKNDFSYSPYAESLSLLQIYRGLMLLPVIISLVVLMWDTPTPGKDKPLKSTAVFIVNFIFSCSVLTLLLSSPDILLPPSQQLENRIEPLDWFELIAVNGGFIMLVFCGLKFVIDTAKTAYHTYLTKRI